MNDKAGPTWRDACPDGSRVFFDAVLHPHRSLTRRGTAILTAVFAILLGAIGTLFLILGAWPVVGFCGLELLLLFVALRVNLRAARAYERVRLCDDALEISRVRANGSPVGCWRFQPNWLRVTVDDGPDQDSRLTLSSHGRSLVIGTFLTPDERQGLARELRRAIDIWRTAPARAVADSRA